MNINKTTAKQIQVLTVFSLVMITVGSVDSIQKLTCNRAIWQLFDFLFTMAAIFSYSSALVSAELSAAWPSKGVFMSG